MFSKSQKDVSDQNTAFGGVGPSGTGSYHGKAYASFVSSLLLGAHNPH